MISTQQISYILALVESGNFSKAASNCFVTQPTLSMQIKKAEDQLGRPIFHRDGNTLALTAFGEKLIPIIRQVQQDYTEIEGLVQQFSGKYLDRLRIGIIPTITTYLLEDCYSEWKKLFPNTQLHIEELTTVELLTALENRSIDLAILAGPVNQSNLRVSPLFTEEILAYTPVNLEKDISLDALQQLQPWLLSKGHCLRTQMMQFCELNDQQNGGWSYAGGNLDVLMRMVDNEGGYTLVPECYARKVKDEENRFKRILNYDKQSPGRSIIAVSHFRNTNWGLMEKMIRAIQLQYQDKPTDLLTILSWK